MWKTPKFDLITQTYPCIEMLDKRKEQRSCETMALVKGIVMHVNMPVRTPLLPKLCL